MPILKYLILAVLIDLACSCCRLENVEPCRDTCDIIPSYSSEDIFKCDLLCDGWVLYRVFVGDVGMPLEAFERLLAARDGERRLIRRRNDLVKLVHIGNERQALELARLFSMPGSHHFFEDSDFIEVSPAGEAERYYGVLSIADCDQYGIRPPEVSRVDGNYLIDRYVLDVNCDVSRIREVIKTSGKYSIVSRTLVIRDSDAVYPAYE